MNCNSHSSNLAGIAKVQDMYTADLEGAGFNVTRHEGGSYGDHLIAENQVTGKPILLVAHADTAQPDNPLFQTAQRLGDTVRGPGGYDMKAGVGVALLALAALREVGVFEKIPLRFLIIGDEEIGMPGSYALHAEAARNCRFALVLESGRPSNTIVLTRKGIALCEATAYGKKAHSGNAFWNGANAVVQLARTVVALSELSSRDRDVSINVGTIEGGSSATVVPDIAKAKFDIRTAVMSDLEATFAAAQEIAARDCLPGTSVSIEQRLLVPPMELQPGMEDLAHSYIAVLHEMGQEGSTNRDIVGGASSASLLTAAELPTLDAFGPAGGGAHTDEEWFSIDSFRIKAEALARFLARQ